MTGDAATERRVLVIKLGALGDVVMAFGPFAAIRARHPDARITLLTTAPFAALARRSPWFDTVAVDARPAWWNLAGWLRLRRQLAGFDLVYDLQTSSRSSRYHRLAGRPDWSGIAPGASRPHRHAGRNAMHTLDRQRDQLRMAGIAQFPEPALDWLCDAPPMAVPPRAVLLVPGAAPHRPGKRWPAAQYGALAAWLAGQGCTPLVVGAAQDAALAAEIARHCPAALDLTGRTSLPQLAGLARQAVLAVGNDTGPMHLAAAMGCPGIVLFSGDSDPALTAPRGDVAVLRSPLLADLDIAAVQAAVLNRLNRVAR